MKLNVGKLATIGALAIGAVISTIVTQVQTEQMVKQAVKDELENREKES